jgi:pilus assembly protein CpaC
VSLVLLAAPARSVAAPPGVAKLDVTLGQSRVLELPETITRVSVTNPAIADVHVITPSQVLIHGKGLGVTSLVVFYPRRTLFFDVTVQANTDLIRQRLRALAPRDEIRVHPAHEGIVLEGTASSQVVLTGVLEVAAAYAPKGKIINMIRLVDAKPPQVMLQVHVAEIDREALEELGFSWRALGSTLQAAMFPGLPFFPIGGTVGAVTRGGVPGTTSPDMGFTTPQGGGGLFLSSGARDYAGVVQALAARNALRTLAKPNLVTESGKEAKFLSGGEFPFPVAQQNNTITIEFKEFGIGLGFLPVVDGEEINVRVRPEVSSLDFSQGLVTSGFSIPVIRKNEAFTNVRLKDGGSFAVAGLVNNEVRRSVAKVPILGDIPVLGALFRSTRFRNSETELLFVVTTKLVVAPVPGSAESPDPRRLMELSPGEKKEFLILPGVPSYDAPGEPPFGRSNLEPATRSTP